jgi:quercetin dioxygenase-like cupin family protein
VDEYNVHTGEECHLVLKGKVMAQQGEDTAILEEGDTFSWRSCVPHLVRNLGEEAALLLIASYSESDNDIM